MNTSTIASIVILLSGCTTELVATKVTEDTPPPIKGFTYALPYTQFEITVTRRLRSCQDLPQAKDAAPTLPSIIIDYQVAAPTATNLPDSSQVYQVDYSKLSSGWKTSDLKLTNFATGMLQQINASAEDRTAQVITNTVTGLGTLALSVASGGFAVPAVSLNENATTRSTYVASAKQPKPHCGVNVLANERKRDDLDGKLKRDTEKLNAATTEFKSMTGVAVSMGSELDPSIQKALLDQAKLVASYSEAVSNTTNAFAENQKLLTNITTFRFPTSGAASWVAGGQELVIPGGLDALKQWIKCTNQAGKDVDCGTDELVPEGYYTDYFRTAIRLQRVPGADVILKSGLSEEPSGIRYRAPVRGQLFVCLTSIVSSNGLDTDKPRTAARANGEKPGVTLDNPRSDPIRTCDASDTTIPTSLPASSSALWEGPVGQLGRLQFLVLKNEPFQNNLLSATFNQDGSLASAEFQDKAATLELATGAASQAASIAAKTIASIQNAPTTKLTAEAARANAQDSLITAQNNLIAAQANSERAKQVALAATNTTLLNAINAQINAEIALDKARATLAGQVPK